MSTEAVEVLGRKYSVDILRAAREPRSVSWLSQELDIPIATCYRRVKELSEIPCCTFKINSPDGAVGPESGQVVMSGTQILRTI